MIDRIRCYRIDGESQIIPSKSKTAASKRGFDIRLKQKEGVRRNKSPNISLCWVVSPLGSKVLKFIRKQTVKAKAVEQGRSAWGEIKNCVELAAVQ